jgi:glycosyltransferase involved in cell wall biosynthesis
MIFCSTIIPTIARPSLERTVRSVLGQVLNEATFEVIVVNDSGRPLPLAEWLDSPRVRVIDTNRRERAVARNTGAAVASGRYLHFLDDDDWLLPDALHAIWELAQASKAGWLYGRSQLVNRQQQPLLQLHHGLQGNAFAQVIAGEWIPLQASFIEAAAFFRVGGFNNLMHTAEDIDLLRRVALHFDVAPTRAVVAAISMGSQGSSSDWAGHAEYSRWGRERILDEPLAYARLRGSASSAFWQGRVVRAYLTSAVWNLRRRRVFTSASRTCDGVAALALAGPRALAPDFWRALLRAYASPAFTYR